MKKLRWILLAVVAAAALIALVLPRLLPEERRPAGGGLSLWYSERDCPRETMEAWLSAYAQETGEEIAAVSFADEDALAEAFETRQPTLMLCSHVRAAGIDERLGLAHLNSLPPEPSALEDALSGLDGAFFPIGGRVTLLLTDAERIGYDFDSFEELLRAAAEADAPFLAAESWTELLYQTMYMHGRQMSGLIAEDSRDAVYTALYNALAEAAYEGGLAQVFDPAEYVRQGLLPCAVVSSSALAGLEGRALRACPLPVPEGGHEGCSGELMGFAVVNAGRNASPAKSFLQWLAAGEHRAAMALDAGLVPLDKTEAAPDANAFDRLLTELAAGGQLRYPAPTLPYFANRIQGESELRERLDLLR